MDTPTSERSVHIQRPDPRPRALTEDPFRRKYKPQTEEALAHVDQIKTAAEDLHQFFEWLGNSRELSLAKTKLEECVFWATKHVTA